MTHKPNEHAKHPTSTKSGPGRYHVQGDGLHRDLTLKQRKAGAYGKGLRNWANTKAAAAMADNLAKRMRRQMAAA